MKQILLLILIFSLSSCKPDDTKKAIEKTLKTNQLKDSLSSINRSDKLLNNINTLFSKHKKKKVVFNVAFRKQNIKTENGIVVFFDPEIFSLENQKLTKKDTIQLTINDYYSKKDFILNDLQTISREGLLISNGMFFIEVKHNNKKLKIKKTKHLSLQFPVKSNREMYLYYKEKESSVWIKSDQKLKLSKEYTKIKKTATLLPKISDDNIDQLLNYEDDDGFSTEEVNQTEVNSKSIEQKKQEIKNSNISSNEKEVRKLKRTFYNIKLKKLGWFNTDVFYRLKKKTDIVVKISNSKTIDIAVSYLVFQNINSVSKLVIENSKKNTFKSLPLNKKVKLISIYIDEKDLYYDEKEFITSKKNYITINLEKISEKEFIKKLDKL